MDLLIKIGNAFIPLIYYYILGLGMIGIYAIMEEKIRNKFGFKISLSLLYLSLVLYLDSIFKLAQKLSGLV